MMDVKKNGIQFIFIILGVLSGVSYIIFNRIGRTGLVQIVGCMLALKIYEESTGNKYLDYGFYALLGVLMFI